MVLRQSIAERAVGWLWFVAALLVPGVVATALWSPFLLSDRIESLFATLPPFDAPAPSYVLFGTCASLPYVVGFLAVLAAVGPDGVALSNALLDVGLTLSVLYVVGLPALCVFVLPEVGIDWDRTGYGRSTWALLIAGSAWYAALFAVPIAVASLVFALPGGY